MEKPKHRAVMFSAETRIRLVPMQVSIVLSILFLALGFVISFHFWWPLIVFMPLALLGLYDYTQPKHSLLRNYPIMGRMRFILEALGPPIHQYFIESNQDGAPFNRDWRTLMYQRAKGIEAKKPFGTEMDVYKTNYEWLNHSLTPRPISEEEPRVTIGGPQCSKPYSASVFNISAMSFGSLGPNAVLALNTGAKRGNFYHCTGEGGISKYHRQPGGDLNWQIGSGYFGCRKEDGSFDPDQFAEQSQDDQVKMVEIKLSQGAKPGHGGILPGAKVTAEIAEARKVPIGTTCESPSYHKEFSTPIGLLEFVARLRELSGGKPIGFKLCIGHPWEFMAICKAMLKTEITPDFIVVDGAEGGTGAAPLELTDHMGTPLREGLVFVQNALVGAGVRDSIRIGVSGKMVSPGLIAAGMAIGADYANSARGFMFALGCLQTQRCHSNECPVGITTQDPKMQKALVVEDKAQRVYQYHEGTINVLKEIVAAAGLRHPSEFRPEYITMRTGPTEVKSLEEVYDFLKPGELVAGSDHPIFTKFWEMATAESFHSKDYEVQS
jgi:glutamate synthase domain-containing protein 2